MQYLSLKVGGKRLMQRKKGHTSSEQVTMSVQGTEKED